jgi:hypothetical protein
MKVIPRDRYIEVFDSLDALNTEKKRIQDLFGNPPGRVMDKNGNITTPTDLIYHSMTHAIDQSVAIGFEDVAIALIDTFDDGNIANPDLKRLFLEYRNWNMNRTYDGKTKEELRNEAIDYYQKCPPILFIIIVLSSALTIYRFNVSMSPSLGKWVHDNGKYLNAIL